MSAGWKLILWDGKDFFLQSVNRLNWLVWSQCIHFFRSSVIVTSLLGDAFYWERKKWRHSTQLSTETCNQQDAEWMNITRTKTHNCKIKNSLLFMKHSAVVSTPFYQHCGFFILPSFFLLCVCVRAFHWIFF